MRSSKSRSRNKSNRQRSIGNIINRVFDSSGPEGKVRGTPQQIIEKYLALARDAQLGNDRVAEQNFLQHAEHYTRMLGEAQREIAREQEERQRNFQQNGNNQNGGQNGGGQNGNGNGGRDRQERFERDSAPRYDDAGENSRGGSAMAIAPETPAGEIVADAFGIADLHAPEQPVSDPRPVEQPAVEPREPRRAEQRPPKRQPLAVMMPPIFPAAEDEGPGLVATPESAEPAPTTATVAAAAPEPVPAAEAAEPAAKARAPRRPRKPRAPKGEAGVEAPSETTGE